MHHDKAIYKLTLLRLLYFGQSASVYRAFWVNLYLPTISSIAESDYTKVNI